MKLNAEFVSSYYTKAAISLRAKKIKNKLNHKYTQTPRKQRDKIDKMVIP
jgi:hypothetical protein